MHGRRSLLALAALALGATVWLSLPKPTHAGRSPNARETRRFVAVVTARRRFERFVGTEHPAGAEASVDRTQPRPWPVTITLVPGPAMHVDDSSHDGVKLSVTTGKVCKPRGRPVDPLDAVHACMAGDASGCFDVGTYYEDGECDPLSAIKWYRAACARGHEASCDALGRVDDGK